jgi:hypothetical protein
MSAPEVYPCARPSCHDADMRCQQIKAQVYDMEFNRK